MEIRERRGGLRLPGPGGHDLRTVETGEHRPGGPAVRPVPGAEQRVYRHWPAGCPESAQHRVQHVPLHHLPGGAGLRLQEVQSPQGGGHPLRQGTTISF